ncbi:glycosyl hydrolase 5 (cellulase A) family [Rhizoctonia solani]|uniref:Glycosyl hydrolase 5 (Cellulase A) family n=1 Tax=Rhizoctonia solani TaxID=456999 RepID=A0A8H7IA00_9AGAM|nr:glycosyl hydrolase 5 (cellulase A) family [Rhizoctonia solani]
MSPVQIKVPPPPAPSPLGVLKIEGSKIVGNDGKPITGYPGHENDMRKAVKRVLGQEKYEYFFDKFLEYFFTEKDAEFFASLGLNCIRIPFNYRHFEDDLNPGVYNERGFQWLDRIINICAHHGIYTILDLHAAPEVKMSTGTAIRASTGPCFGNTLNSKIEQLLSGKNWPGAIRETLGSVRHANVGAFSDLVTILQVAGYNPLNEPTDEEHTRVLDWYARAEKAIHAIDPDHIVSTEAVVGLNVVLIYNIAVLGWKYFCCRLLPTHFRALYIRFMTTRITGFRSHRVGTPEQKEKLESSFKRKIAYTTKRQVATSGMVNLYASPADGSDWEKINERRYHVLKDQLAIYDQYQISWSIWLYKDIGFQGMVYTSPESPYIKLFEAFLAKKKRLAADSWGADTTTVQSAFDPIEKLITEEVTHIQKRYPPTWKVKKHGRKESPANR